MTVPSDRKEAERIREWAALGFDWGDLDVEAEHVVALLDALVAERDAAVAALREIAAQQQRTLGWLEAHGIVFDGPLGKDPKNWQHVAFSIYTDLCEVDLWARQALDAVSGSPDSETPGSV